MKPKYQNKSRIVELIDPGISGFELDYPDGIFIIGR